MNIIYIYTLEGALQKDQCLNFKTGMLYILISLVGTNQTLIAVEWVYKGVAKATELLHLSCILFRINNQCTILFVLLLLNKIYVIDILRGKFWSI